MDDTVEYLSTVNHVTPSQHYQEVEGDSDSPSVSNSNHHSSSPPLLWPRCFIREEYRSKYQALPHEPITFSLIHQLGSLGRRNGYTQIIHIGVILRI
jgi:hypothetical protein